MFLIPPTFSSQAVHQMVEEFLKKMKAVSSSRYPRPTLLEAWHDFREVSTIEDMGRCLERLLLELHGKSPFSSDPSYVREFLIQLWHIRALGWPIHSAELLGRFRISKTRGWNADLVKLLTDIRTASPGNPKGAAAFSIARSVAEFLLSCVGASEIGDLTPDVIGSYFSSVMQPSGLRQSAASDVLKLQQNIHGAAVIHQLVDYGKFGRQPVRSDDRFSWALDADNTLGEWTTIMASYMPTLKASVLNYRTTLNKFLDYLIANPDIPRHPVEYCRITYSPMHKFEAGTGKNINVIYYFFDYLLDTHCIEEDDLGYKVRLPGFCNPFVPVPHPPRAAETHREAMPTRFVRMMHDILVEHDYAWARQYGISRWNRKGGDMTKWVNPDTRVAEEVWSPVRATALLVKLLLPSRTMQVRMLDSGEADTEEYQPQDNRWISNIGPLSPPKKTKIEKGVFARHKDRDGQEYVFLRFNTNKTADIDKDPGAAGYIMPWQHTEVIQLFASLRDWQKKYNPIHRPTLWSDIKDMSISTRYPKEALKARGANCFLFRDPCSPLREQPVTDMRLTGMWRNLNLELERRLAAAGETLPDGSPIVLVQKTAQGLGKTVYDLHSLRVTLITALAESGGVPPTVLMKVVGHASVIMTLYYTKLSPAHICEQLNEGALKLHNLEQMNWQKWLMNQSRETLLKSVAHTTPSAIEALTTTSPTSWIVRDHGICPVGCSRCHEGGEPVVNTAAYQKWEAVQGGASNCVRCRFFITGPAFLLGLQAYFDNLSFRLRDASERYQAAKTKFEVLEAEYKFRLSDGQQISSQERHQLEVAASHFDQRTSEVDGLSLSWHAAFRLVQQCLGLMKKTSLETDVDKTPKYSLVAVGGFTNLEAVLEECSDFELIDRICQSATFFEGIDSTMPNLKRMRSFDAMLKRNGYSPVFFELGEQDALSAGNQMAAFLFTWLGRETANALMAGKETLRRLGLEDEAALKFQSFIPIRLSRNNECVAVDISKETAQLKSLVAEERS